MTHSTNVPAGLAYLIEHGRAADGSDGDREGSAQALVNPAQHNPTVSDPVTDWIKHRAASDDQMQAAAAGKAAS